MNKVKNYGLIVLAVFCLILAWQVKHYLKKYKEQKIETNRVKHNYEVSISYAKLIKGENDLYASRIEKQELTIQELKSYYSNLVADIADMKIQLRKVTGITAFNTETTNNINTLFKDSLRIDSVTIQTLSYSDKWFDISIVKTGLEAKINTISRDSLIQVVHWERSGVFWPTRFLTKKVYYQDIKSMNPNSRITYSKWILPIKK
jgi:hypothetical protein